MQGGSDGMPIVGDFAVKYASRAQDLGVPIDDLYKALVDTAENTVSPCFVVSLGYRYLKHAVTSLWLAAKLVSR